jgi:hypothetical protein
MGLYSTIEGEQVKCFFAPCFPIAENVVDANKTKELCFYSSGGKLVYYGIGNQVPYATPFYNYTKNFIIFDYREFVHLRETQKVIIIKEGKVLEVKPYTEIVDEDLLNINYVVDNYGSPLNIKTKKDFSLIVDDYKNAHEEYITLSEIYKKENNCEINIYNLPKPITQEVMDKIKLSRECTERAFQETLEPTNKKWRIDENSNIYKQIHGHYQFGFIYHSLLSEDINEDDKKLTIKLFKEKIQEENEGNFEELLNKYISWLKNSDAFTSEKEIKKIFEKYNENEKV